MNSISQTTGSHRENPSRPVTRDMLYARTTELAMMAGRSSHEIRQVDYERAKYELTGERDFDRQQAFLLQDGEVTTRLLPQLHKTASIPSDP